jgi:hypothetical protein
MDLHDDLEEFAGLMGCETHRVERGAQRPKGGAEVHDVLDPGDQDDQRVPDPFLAEYGQ